MNVDAGNVEDNQKNEEESRGAGAAKDAANDNEIDLSPEALEIAEKRRQEQEELQEKVQEGMRMSDDEFDYKLVGVVIHMGIATAGHYITYINIDREGNPTDNCDDWFKTDKQTWLEFNDSIVSHFDYSRMQYKAFGED